MRKRNIVIVAVLLSCLIAGASLALGSVLNTISFHGNIGPGNFSMSQAISLDLGNLTENSTGGSGPNENGLPIDGNATLTLTSMSNVIISFGNSTDLSPFTAFSVILQLYFNGSPAYQGSVNQGSTSFTIPNVFAGTYEIFVGYTYTAGTNESSFNIVLNVSTP